MPLIKVEGLSFSYGAGELQRQVLKDVNLSIEEAKIVIVTGPSGSGKTTLLTIIGGLRRAASGSVKVFDVELVDSDDAVRGAVRRRIGYVFQQHNLLKPLTALQNVCMALELEDGLNEPERKRRAMEMLAAVGLADRSGHRPAQLSGGQRQRVSIARALVRSPKIVLADEPTASLDRASGQEAVAILKRLARECRTTIVLVTHDYRILDLADQVVTMEDGVITGG